MLDTIRLSLAWIVGTLLGVVFYGGLWWTIRKAVTSSAPALWFLGSLLTRIALVLAGFYWVSSGGHWAPALTCMLGFIAARFVVTWMVRPLTQAANQEATHAN